MPPLKAQLKLLTTSFRIFVLQCTVAIGDAISPDFNPIVDILNGIAHAAADIGNEAEEMGKAAQKFLKNIAGNVSGNPEDFDPNDSDKSTDLIKFTSRQLQKKFDHASDFGVEGNYSKANAAEFRSAIQDHIGNSSTQRIEGWYRNQQVTHYYNPDTGLNVIVGRSDNQFISRWKLSDEQVWNLINNAGKLGGG